MEKYTIGNDSSNDLSEVYETQQDEPAILWAAEADVSSDQDNQVTKNRETSEPTRASAFGPDIYGSFYN